MNRNYVTILKVKISSTTTASVLSILVEKLKKSPAIAGQMRKFYIVSANPETVFLAQTDKSLREIINNADISIPDGVGIVAGYKFLKLPVYQLLFLKFPFYILQGIIVGASIVFARGWLTQGMKVIKGRELMVNLLKLANKDNLKVFLFGSTPQVIQDSIGLIVRKYPKVIISGLGGGEYDKNGFPETIEDKKIEQKAMGEINRFGPDLLFVAMSPPKQEKWLNRWLSKLNVKVAMVVGGSLDYFVGKVTLPPRWIENMGFEWAWRLFTQFSRPNHIKRIINATVIFPIKVFQYKLRISRN